MSSVMELTASQESHEEGINERLDHFLNMDPTLSNNLSLSADTFLKAAMALKNQVRLLLVSLGQKIVLTFKPLSMYHVIVNTRTGFYKGCFSY